MKMESGSRFRCPEIGILAGMGPRSTAPFLDLVITQCQIQYGARVDEDYPAIMVYSLPTPFYVDRPPDHRRMTAVIQDGLRRLAQTGVGMIAMPCVTAHAYWETLAASIDIPLLNMIDETIASLDRDSRKVALLATRATIASGIFQSKLREKGIEVAADSKWQNIVDGLITGVKANQDRGALMASFAELLSDVCRRTNTAVVACTDLSVLRLPEQMSIRKVDAAEVLAASLVREYLAHKEMQ